VGAMPPDISNLPLPKKYKVVQLHNEYKSGQGMPHIICPGNVIYIPSLREGILI